MDINEVSAQLAIKLLDDGTVKDALYKAAAEGKDDMAGAIATKVGEMYTTIYNAVFHAARDRK